MGRGDDIKKILTLAKNMRECDNGYSIEDIMNECGGISRSTAIRIKRILEDVFDLEEVDNYPSKVKKWRLKRGTLDRILSFNADEIATLENCQAYMKSQNYTNSCDLLPDIIQKMKFTTKSGDHCDADYLLESHGYAVHQAPKHKIDREVFDKISEAILSQQYLSFRYTNNKGEEKHRTVAPYAVIYSEYTYLVAKEEGSDVLKHFLLFRMKNVRVAVERGYYDKDDNFNLQEHLSKSFGAFQEAPMKIKLLFSDKVKDRIQNYNVHPNQEVEFNPDGTTTVTFEAGGIYEICWFLFRWGKDVQILEPQELKDKYKKLLQEIIEKY